MNCASEDIWVQSWGAEPSALAAENKRKQSQAELNPESQWSAGFGPQHQMIPQSKGKGRQTARLGDHCFPASVVI